MSDNPSAGSDSASTAQAKLLQDLLPLFKEGAGSPDVFSAADMNRLVRVLRAIRSLKINCQFATESSDGTFNPAAKIKWGDENCIIDLLFPPGSDGGGSGNAVSLWQVVSYNTGDEFVTCLAAQATAEATYTTSGSNTKIAVPYLLRTNDNGCASVFPNYNAGDILIATQPTGGTGVFDGADDLGWVDVNYDNRHWLEVDYFKINVVSGALRMFANYWEGKSILSNNVVAIAKNPSLRNSITSETIDGVTYAYTYGASSPYTFVSRKADFTISSTNYTDYQVIVPRYLTSSIIKARVMPTGLLDGSSNPIMWQEESGREWASRASQAGYENV